MEGKAIGKKRRSSERSVHRNVENCFFISDYLPSSSRKQDVHKKRDFQGRCGLRLKVAPINNMWNVLIRVKYVLAVEKRQTSQKRVDFLEQGIGFFLTLFCMDVGCLFCQLFKGLQ